MMNFTFTLNTLNAVHSKNISTLHSDCICYCSRSSFVIKQMRFSHFVVYDSACSDTYFDRNERARTWAYYTRHVCLSVQSQNIENTKEENIIRQCTDLMYVHTYVCYLRKAFINNKIVLYKTEIIRKYNLKM